MKRMLCACSLLASSLAIQAEAGKGLSRISTGDILWFIFLAGFALPAGVDYAAYWGLRLLGWAPSLTAMLVGAVACWWLGLYVFFSIIVK